LNKKKVYDIIGAGVRGLMDEFIKQLDEHLNYIRHETVGDTLEIYVESNRREAVCPYCGTASGKVHSIYERSIQDLPIMGMKTELIIRNRKLICQNPECSHTTFAERYDFMRPKGKKTKRLLDKIVEISVSVSSLAATGILRNGIVDVGKSTICNLLKKRSPSSE
jgi:transposase